MRHSPNDLQTPTTLQNTTHTELVSHALSTGSFVLALMLYAGFIHSNAYFGYFHLDTFAVGYDTFELAVRSLRLATPPVLATLALAVIAPRAPELLTGLGLPAHLIHRVGNIMHEVARRYLYFIATGLVLIALWRYVQPVAWAAPLLVACGLLLGQSRAAASAGQRHSRLWQRVVAVAVVGLFFMWVVALAAGQLGRQDARHDARNLERRVAVVLLSTERLSITGPAGLRSEDLGKGTHYRYRYSGLRLLVERDHRYYLLPLGWNHNTDATYVIEDDSDIRLELLPGVQRP